MELVSGIVAHGLGLSLTAHKTLVLSDLHLGLEDSLRRGGVFVPRQHMKETLARIERLLVVFPSTKRVILNGDLKHEFGRISEQEWREIKRLIDALRKKNLDVVIVKGNHDIFLQPIASERGLRVVDAFTVGDVLVTHGDKAPTPAALKGITTIIIGHEHPAIVLHEKAKAEKYKCFLVTRYKRKHLIVQPSFGPLTSGIDVLRGELQSPLLSSTSRNALVGRTGRVFIVDEKTDDVLDFGLLRKLV